MFLTSTSAAISIIVSGGSKSAPRFREFSRSPVKLHPLPVTHGNCYSSGRWSCHPRLCASRHDNGNILESPCGPGCSDKCPMRLSDPGKRCGCKSQELPGQPHECLAIDLHIGRDN